MMVYANNADEPDSNGVCGTFDQLAYPALSGVQFIANSATRGGAALFRVAVSASITGALFSGNTATDRGGALYIDYGGCTEVTTSTFEGNSAGGSGGGVYIDDNASQFPPTEPTFTDVGFEANTATDRGGGLYIYHTSATGHVEVSAAGPWFSSKAAPGKEISNDRRGGASPLARLARSRIWILPERGEPRGDAHPRRGWIGVFLERPNSATEGGAIGVGSGATLLHSTEADLGISDGAAGDNDLAVADDAVAEER